MRESRHSRRERSSPYSNAPQAPQKLNMPTVFVGNLAPEVTEEVLIDVFKDCGDMKDVRLKRHRDTGKAKGYVVKTNGLIFLEKGVKKME